ncbi:MAG: flagellar assembly peptidoglycan hydrolase FlgJ [Gammaproteobacteria bacterium]
MSTAIDTNVYTDPQGLAQLRREARAEGGEHSPETLRKVAGQFEALFVQQMLKALRDSSLNEGLMDNDQTKFYQGMFDQQISLEMTRGQGLGLAEMLVRQLGGAAAAAAVSRPPALTDPFAGSRASDGHANITGSAALEPAAAGRTAGPAAEHTDWRPASREQFVAELLPLAERAAQRLGVDARVLVAQAALETGWGQHIMPGRDGRSSHNLFGIKADGRWDGAQVSQRTVEYRHGVLQREQASFRAYGSPAHSLSDYADFIIGNPRYGEALGSRDPQRYVTELQRAGYATDPAYASKIMKIYNSDAFQGAVAAVQAQHAQAATEAQEVSVMHTQPVPSADNAAARAGEV